MLQPEIIRLSLPKRIPDPEPKAPPPPRPTIDTVPALLERFAHVRSPASRNGLTESAYRVLKALGPGPAQASALARDLRLSQSHLSHTVKRLKTKGLLERGTTADRRKAPLSLTREGRNLLRRAEAEWRDELHQALNREAQRAMEPRPETAFRLRLLKRGDMALLAHRLVMAEETTDEAATLARSAAFLSDHNPHRDIGWIGEAGGHLAGACLLKGGTGGTAELTMIHAEAPGLAGELIENCVTFAEVAKYTEVTTRVPESRQDIELALAENGFRLLRNMQDTAAAETGRSWARKL